MSSRFPLYIIGTVLFASFFSCTDMVPTKEVRLIDSLNGKAYAYRYRSLDSSYKYANEAYRQVNFYKSGKAEASNNLGFCAFMAMDFDRAEALHKEVYKLTKNELELLIADIGLMKICQRTAMNKEFYDYRNSCLLYTSDAADDLLCVDLGGRRIIKKKQSYTKIGQLCR